MSTEEIARRLTVIHGFPLRSAMVAVGSAAYTIAKDRSTFSAEEAERIEELALQSPLGRMHQALKKA